MAAMAKKIIVLLILSLVFGQIVRIPLPGVAGAFVTPIDFLVILLLPFWVSSFSRSKLAAPIMAFFLLGLFSLLLNSKNLTFLELFTSLLYSVRFFILAGIYFTIRRFDVKTKEKLLYWLAGCGVVVVILGLIQYFLYPDLRNLYYAGWDEHLYRVFSTFLDPNFAGTFFVLVFVLLLGLTFREKAKVRRMLFSIGLLLTFISILLTYSRSAFIMFVVSVSILLLFCKKRIILSMLLALFVLGIVLLPKSLPSEGVKLNRTASITARQDSAQKAVVIFRDNPFFGVGFNAYKFAQMRYGFLKDPNIHSGAGTDNSFLFVLATTGIVGILAFIYLWYRVIWIAFKNQSLTSYIIIASSVGLLINSFFINSLFYESIIVWMWIMVGIRERK